jgi:S1-C subfamily serine protease
MQQRRVIGPIWGRMIGFVPVLLLSVSVCAAPVQGQSGLDESAQADLRAANALSRAFEHAAELVESAVVHITTEAEIQRYRQDRFGRRFRVGSPELQPNGLGSGVVIDASNGLVLTNHHVIKDGDRLVVRLEDGREIEATLVGSDESTDLAVLRIEADGLVDARLGDSDALRVGEWVLALGSPFGFDSTVTAGIVSAKGRSLSRDPNAPNYQEFIQTDAAINPGNSGGPLINLSGEVIGINTAIISSTRQSAGLGFAIPSAIAERVIDSIVDHGRVRRGYLGVEMRDLTPFERRERGLDSDVGVAIKFVQDGTPAAAAGLEQGDVVLTIDGRAVEGGLNRLRNLISLTEPGSDIEIELLRGQRKMAVRATVADSTEMRAAQLNGEAIYELGVIVRANTPEISKELGYRRHVPGVLVLDVQSGTPAAEAGLEVGDILTKIDRYGIDDPSELRRRLPGAGGDDIEGKSVTLELVRKRLRGSVEVILK